jgi:hypothetical protein
MQHLTNSLNLSLRILTYNAPSTLEKTLNSIFSKKIENMFSEILFLQI